MEWCYNNNFEGDEVFGRVLHKFFVDHFPLSVGVRTRKDLMVEIISQEHRRVLANKNEDANFRVVSLGCGPAKEVSEYISRARTWPGKSEWTLIDQEEEALSVAYQASRRQIGQWQSNADLSLLNLSFVQMLSEGLPFQEPGAKDLIFSVGLFDYLRESRAQVLIRAMYDLLDENGLIVIGNAVAPNEFFWAAEFLGDWTLLYRTKEEMRMLASLVPESAEVNVTTEPAGAYHFLLVRKNLNR
jgi:SAM-dependent methyltransferase